MSALNSPSTGSSATNSTASTGRARSASLTKVLSRQHGVISLDQAEDLGLTMSSIRYRIRPGGPWQRIFPGVYLTVSGTATSDQLDMAALLYAARGSAITGLAALRRWGVVQAAAAREVDVLVPAQCCRASRDYVRIHRTTRLPRLVAVDQEIQVVLIPRAVVDAARDIASIEDLRALVAGAVQQGNCTPRELAAELGQSRLRNAASVRAVLAEVNLGIRSAPEGDLMDLVKRAGLPEPYYNPRLYMDGKLLASPDAWWPAVSVAVEVDSQLWHASPADWQRTMERHDRMAAAGIRVLHFSPRQIRTEPEVVIGIIRQALSVGAPSPRIETRPIGTSAGTRGLTATG